mmetsp:Transcript_5345/g.7387  ORF Transcript_5345/g.7387 Transcript_5345/m.7387 type:complete len:942 (+) Transcript_5345:12-2837(+)
MIRLVYQYFVFFFLYKKAYSAGVCQTLVIKSTTSLTNPCANVVDYPFFISASLTAYANYIKVDPQYLLEQKVQSKLNDAKIRSLSLPCQQAVKSITCANIYLKCTGPNIVDYKTYSVDSNYTFGIQVQRPCKSVCTDMLTSCTGIFLVNNTYPNCTSRFDYSFGAAPVSKMPLLYDKSNNMTTCFKPKSVAIAPPSEPYLFKTNGVCKGLYEEVYTSPGSVINSTYATLQEPFVIQRLIEKKLEKAWKTVPTWLSPSCMAATRQFFCANGYSKAQKKFVYEVLQENKVLPQIIGLAKLQNPSLYYDSVYVPSFANYSVCQNFVRECQGFIKQANAKSMVINSNCSVTRKLASGVVGRSFPQTPETIAFIRFKPIPTLTYNLRVTSTAYVFPSQNGEPSNSSETTVCPATFVIPDHPFDSAVSYAPPSSNSSCAVPCRNPAWTESDWDAIVNAAFVVPLIGVILCGLMLCSIILWYWSTKVQRGAKNAGFTYIDVQTVLFCLYVLLSLSVSVISVMLNSPSSYMKRFCYDNAIGLSLTETGGLSLCVIQAGMIVYTFFAISLNFLMMFVIRFILYLVVTDVQSIYEYQYSLVNLCATALLCVCLVFLVPIKPLLYSHEKGLLGFQRTAPYCGVLSRPLVSDKDALPAMDLPMLLSGGMCIIAMILNFLSPIMRRICRRNAAVHIYSLDQSGSKVVNDNNSEMNMQLVKQKSMKTSSLPVEDEAITRADTNAVNAVEPFRKSDIESNKTMNEVEDPCKKEQLDNKRQDDENSAIDNRNDMIAVDALLYLLPILLIYAIYAAARVIYYQQYDSISQSVIDWITCLFQNSNSWEASCGVSPNNKPSVLLNTVVLILYTGNSIIVAPFYFFNVYGLPLFRSLFRGKKPANNAKPALSSSKSDEDYLAKTPQVVNNIADNNAETVQKNQVMMVEPLAIVNEGHEEDP